MNANMKSSLCRLVDPSLAVRTKALKSMSRSRFSEFRSDYHVKLLFESLFRTFWLADTKVVDDTAAEIVAVLKRLQASLGDTSTSMAQFWTVLDSNWPGIDRHRLNKFYMLVDSVFKSISSSPPALLSTVQFVRDTCFAKKGHTTGFMLRLVNLLEMAYVPSKHDEEVFARLTLLFVDLAAVIPKVESCSVAVRKVCKVLSDSKVPVPRQAVQGLAETHLQCEKLPGGSRKLLSAILICF